MLNYIIWDFDPTLFAPFGFEIRWYGLMFPIAFGLTLFLCMWMMKKEGNHSVAKLRLWGESTIPDTLFFYLIIAVIVGARLGHCLLYQPEYYLPNPIEILKFRDGGLASHGAAIGILIALYLAAKKHHTSFWYLADRVGIFVAISGVFVRLGNLFNSEIYGHATDLPWGFIFIRDGQIVPKHPTQIYEALCYLAIFAVLLIYYVRKKYKPKEGILFGAFLILLFGARFGVEFLKEVQVDFEKNMLFDMGQLLSIPFVLAGIAILWLAIKNRLPKIPIYKS